MRTSIGKLKWHDKTIKLFQGINDDFLLRWFYHKHTETASTCTAYLARNGSCLSCHLKGLLYDWIGYRVSHFLFVFPRPSQYTGKFSHIPFQQRKFHIIGTLLDAVHGFY